MESCDWPGTVAAVAHVPHDPADEGVVMLDLELQGAPGQHANGSLMEHDRSGVGRELGTRLIEELRRMGATFIAISIAAGCEEPFYESLGFCENTGHKDYIIDERPYVGARVPT